MVKLERVEKYFNRHRRNQIHAVDGTTLELPDKGLVAILGNSGSGKTTLLNVIGGLDKVTKGKIYIDGKKITKVSTSKLDKIRNLKIGYIFQNYHLLEQLTVFENVALVLKMIGIKKKEEIEKRVHYILQVLGMYSYRNRLCYMLSGGQKQRVAIARAIVKNPSIIIADEPTGNLDSKNSIEIMNMIKTISQQKLVILVTHEKELAQFYADRIIQVVDGKIVSDEENSHVNELDYRMYNKIYLKEMPIHEKIEQEQFKIDYYSDQEEKIQVKLVVKNGSIYIQADQKVEAVDEHSGIELVDDHYQKISKEIYESYQFNHENIINDHYKKRYTSIYNIFTLFINGFRKIASYSALKKILLLGFFISAMFVLYAVSSIFGINDIKDEKFVTTNHDYLNVITNQNKVSDYLTYENLEFIDYILPGDSKVEFGISYDDYYQTTQATQRMMASIVASDKLKETDLIYGRMPQTEREIIMDKSILENAIQNLTPKEVGIFHVEDYIGRELTTENQYGGSMSAVTKLKPFVIVGITDQKSPCAYMQRSNFINLLATTQPEKLSFYPSVAQNNQTKLVDVSLAQDEITMKKGRMPKNDYEIIVPYSYASQMKLNKTIDTKVNDQKLKVVGYYENKFGKEEYYSNFNTVKYQLIENSQGLTICPKDKEQTMAYFISNNRNIEDIYDKDKTVYLERMKPQMIAGMIVAGVILLISLLEVFLMIRSSFLSRKKEVGILRAIGVKKLDIYKMFLGEILAIDIIASLPGVALMSYVLNGLEKVSYLSDQFVINGNVIGITLFIVFGFHILIGLLPVFHTLRKTPSAILAGNAID